MLTLKQLSKSLAELQDEYDKIPSKPDGSDIHFYQALEAKQFIKIKDVREWLLQKRQEHSPNVTCGCPDCLTYTIQNRFIDELLKELK